MPDGPVAKGAGSLKVLMISANRERDPSPVFPLGLAYLAGPLEQAGHATRLLDLCFEEDAPAAVRRALDEAAPDVVLVSIRNLDNVTWPSCRSYVDGVREVVALCRERAVVVLGGSGFSLEPVSLLAATRAHCGVVGEGEEVLPHLLERIEAGIPLQGLPGRRRRGRRRACEPAYPGVRRDAEPEPLRRLALPDGRGRGERPDEARLPVRLRLLHLPDPRREPGPYPAGGGRRPRAARPRRRARRRLRRVLRRHLQLPRVRRAGALRGDDRRRASGSPGRPSSTRATSTRASST